VIISTVFAFYVPITPKPEMCRRPFSLAAAEKGGWAQTACPSDLRQALTTPMYSSAGTMSILACGGNHWIALTERGGLMVRGDNAEGQLGIGTRNLEWYPTGLGGIGSVVGDEVRELVGGVHALALLAAIQGHAVTLPAGVLAHPFDDKAAMVSAREEHTLCVTSGGVVYAWGSNLQGQVGVNNTTQQAQAMGVYVRRNTVPLQWSEHLCKGSPARTVACGDHHTLVLTQAGEVFACGRGGHGETGNSLLPDNFFCFY